MCTIQENDNKNKVIDLAEAVVCKIGTVELIKQTVNHIAKLKEAGAEMSLIVYYTAAIEANLDILKHHYNIGREVTTAKTNHLKALETLIK